jgi:hypothetical protein
MTKSNVVVGLVKLVNSISKRSRLWFALGQPERTYACYGHAGGSHQNGTLNIMWQTMHKAHDTDKYMYTLYTVSASCTQKPLIWTPQSCICLHNSGVSSNSLNAYISNRSAQIRSWISDIQIRTKLSQKIPPINTQNVFYSLIVFSLRSFSTTSWIVHLG